MAKMLWELKAPLVIAKAKEDMGLNDIFKYLRYYRMFLERFSYRLGKDDLTERIERILFWRGVVAFVKDPVFGLVIGEVNEKSIKRDPNGKIIKVDVEGENGYNKKNCKVGEDVVLLYSDSTMLAPVLYIWAIAQEIITREDIINQQDNMLRKPIIVAGEGEELDNAINKVANVLSGVAFFNLNPKKSKNSLIDQKEMQVLNLQVGNSYKGPELWQSRSKFEELIKDYLGYMTVNNEKRERMVTDEINESNSICKTFYHSSVKYRKNALEEVKELFGDDIEFEEMLKLESDKKEVKENGSNERKVD